MRPTLTYRSNGKLMLTGEYLALDGAVTLALPTKRGQKLEVFEEEKSSNLLIWKSFTHDDKSWFEAEIDLSDFSVRMTSDEKISNTLIKILLKAKEFSKQSFLSNEKSFSVETFLEFPGNWGLGSSSTLIANVAQWAKVDALKLFFSVFTGSGYDVACALHDTPVFYQKKMPEPMVQPVSFSPAFREEIFVIHLNEKQNSYNEVKKFLKQEKDNAYYSLVDEISNISTQIPNIKTRIEFENLLKRHEEITGKILNQEPIHHRLFKEYKQGVVKSLGAWGGDFILVTGTEKDMLFFEEKGFQTIVPYSEMIEF